MIHLNKIERNPLPQAALTKNNNDGSSAMTFAMPSHETVEPYIGTSYRAVKPQPFGRVDVERSRVTDQGLLFFVSVSVLFYWELLSSQQRLFSSSNSLRISIQLIKKKMLSVN